MVNQIGGPRSVGADGGTKDAMKRVPPSGRRDIHIPRVDPQARMSAPPSIHYSPVVRQLHMPHSACGAGMPRATVTNDPYFL